MAEINIPSDGSKTAQEKTNDEVAEVGDSPVEVVANGNKVVLETIAENEGDGAEDIENTKKEASQLFLQGKRNFVIRDYQSAVASLSQAIQMLTKIYGEQADELGDAYFYYGKALFELARTESDVLGDQVEKDKEDNEDDEGEENEEDEEGGEGGEEGKEEEGRGEKENGGDEEENGDEEDVNDLQLSWEYLELAKLIYRRKADQCKETAAKLCDVYLTLGENGLESESYQTAIEDMEQCLVLQRATLEPHDRRIAETHYHMGVAHTLNENLDEAVTSFEAAIEQLERKLAWLEGGQGQGEGQRKEGDAFYTVEGEVAEIRGVVTEVRDKLSDVLDCRRQLKTEIMKQVVGAASTASGQPSGAGGSSAATSSSAAKQTTDISHLVRKKRKNDAEGAPAEGAEKKQKTDQQD